MAGFDLKQHVDVPTHTAGRTLDLLFTKNDRVHPLLKSVSVTDLSISHHYVVKCKLYTSPPPRPKKKARLAWPLTHISVEIVAHQLGKLLSSFTKGSNVNDLLSDFDSRVKDVLDNIAPLRNHHNQR